MRFRIGYEFIYRLPERTPAILLLNVHSSRASDLEAPDHVLIAPSAETTAYRDEFGNWCTRFVAPAGDVSVSGNAIIADNGLPEPVVSEARQHMVEDLPNDVLVYLRPSRFCDSDRLLDLAWELFGRATPGVARVRAICDFVHAHIEFGYQHARATRTATEAYEECKGVCRDYAHLAVAYCRALNIPARYCTGYLSDEGTEKPYPPGDFAAWFEAYLDGRWHMFDPRNNVPRIGRILIARGRDAADVAMVTTFGPNKLENFRVWADSLPASEA